MNPSFPYRADLYGRTAQADADLHIRELIEQVLFTAPGERVNRPDFGSGLMELVFAPNGDVLAAATQLSVQGSLTRWLGELIEVRSVEAASADSVLAITVRYLIRKTQQAQVATFSRRAT